MRRPVPTAHFALGRQPDEPCTDVERQAGRRARTKHQEPGEIPGMVREPVGIDGQDDAQGRRTSHGRSLCAATAGSAVEAYDRSGFMRE
ncbi:hypothetical protein [Streptomyces sirii]|uniref:hypothetical protein n=1 Tax=Streptomyces sirii TaxID=3127701 RepID=UPI003D3648E1